MRFHQYRTLRNESLASLKDSGAVSEEDRRRLKTISSADCRKQIIDEARQYLKSQSNLEYGTSLLAVSEDIWVDEMRPFYNVWPIAVELAASVALDLPFSSVQFPFRTMLLRFAKGHEPYGICVAMLFWPDERPFVCISAYFTHSTGV